jgi:hypothetical protein
VVQRDGFGGAWALAGPSIVNGRVALAFVDSRESVAFVEIDATGNERARSRYTPEYGVGTRVDAFVLADGGWVVIDGGRTALVDPAADGAVRWSHGDLAIAGEPEDGAATPDGGFVIVGTHEGARGSKIWLHKWTADADPVWEREWAGHGDAPIVTVDADGTIGVIQAAESGVEIRLVGPDGGEASPYRSPGESGATLTPSAAAFDTDGSLVLAGTLRATGAAIWVQKLTR